MEIVARKTDHKIDPKDDKTSPNTTAAIAIGQRNMRQWEAEGRFASEGQKRDYLKAVASNPHNKPGLPLFFPALEIKSCMNDVRAARECSCGGCCIYQNQYICPRCGMDNSERIQ